MTWEPVNAEQRLEQWRQAEKAALDAEHEVARLGQGAASLEAAALFLNAKTLRRQADREFGAILRAIKSNQPGD
ncbi:MAG: hypothetical protein NVS2B4_20320 [Ramlibacter sp.]